MKARPQLAREVSGKMAETHMTLNDLIAPGAIVHALAATSKKQALEELANVAAPLAGIDAMVNVQCLSQSLEK